MHHNYYGATGKRERKRKRKRKIGKGRQVEALD